MLLPKGVTVDIIWSQLNMFLELDETYGYYWNQW